MGSWGWARQQDAFSAEGGSGGKGVGGGGLPMKSGHQRAWEKEIGFACHPSWYSMSGVPGAGLARCLQLGCPT